MGMGCSMQAKLVLACGILTNKKYSAQQAACMNASILL